MEKKSPVKKIVCLLLCLVLTFAAIGMSITTRGFSAGSGKGEDRKISDLGALSELLEGDDFALFPNESGAFAEGRNMTLKAVFSQFKKEAIFGYATTILHNVTVYLTAEGTLFEIETTYSKSKADLYAIMQLYRKKEGTYLRFERIFGAAEGVPFAFPDALLGRWLDLSEVNVQNILDMFALPENKHLTALDIVSRHLKKSPEEGFSQKKGKYTMNQDAFYRFSLDILATEGIFESASGSELELKGDFKVDLSEEKRPQISFSLDTQQVQIDDHEVIVGFTHVIDKVEYAFSNIGNTVIELPKDLKAVGAEEFNEFLEAVR